MKKFKNMDVDQRVSMVTPNNGKRVCLRLRFEDNIVDNAGVDMLWMNNINGITTGTRGMGDGIDREMLQNRSAFDAMVNSMVWLFGMEIVSVEYYSEEEGE